MDPQIAVLLRDRPPVSLDDIPALRAALDAFWQASPPVDPGDVEVSDVVVGVGVGVGVGAGVGDGVGVGVGQSLRVRVRVLVPPGSGPWPVVLSLHGGALALSRPEYHDAFNLGLCRGVGAVVVVPDYRLAPEDPFPAGLEDCYAALEWAVSQDQQDRFGVDPSRVAVVGDSAGATLAAATALLARDRGGPALAFQALLEPVLDDRLETEAMTTDGPHWPTTSRTMFEQMWRYYLAGRPATAYAAPARADDLRGLPPAYLCVPELDALRDEAFEYARRLMAAGVTTELHVWPGAVHGFLDLPVDLARTATAELVDRLSAALR